MKTIENNKLIAEFMGGKKDNHVSDWYYFITDASYHKETDLKYHTSWDWLMPVVEKIDKKSGYFVEIGHCSTLIKSNGLKYVSSCQGKNRLDSTYKSVISFIKWYNHQEIPH